jgi:hypothetical protein
MPKIIRVKINEKINKQKGVILCGIFTFLRVNSRKLLCIESKKATAYQIKFNYSFVVRTWK